MKQSNKPSVFERGASFEANGMQHITYICEDRSIVVYVPGNSGYSGRIEDGTFIASPMSSEPTAAIRAQIEACCA